MQEKANKWKRLKINPKIKSEKENEENSRSEFNKKHHPDYVLIKSIHMDVLIRKWQVHSKTEN